MFGRSLIALAVALSLGTPKADIPPVCPTVNEPCTCSCVWDQPCTCGPELVLAPVVQEKAAQPPVGHHLDQKVADLEAKVAELEGRVKALEDQRGNKVSSPPQEPASRAYAAPVAWDVGGNCAGGNCAPRGYRFAPFNGRFRR